MTNVLDITKKMNLIEDFERNYCANFRATTKFTPDEIRQFEQYSGQKKDDGFSILVQNIMSSPSRNGFKYWDLTPCDIIFARLHFYLLVSEIFRGIFPLDNPLDLPKGKICFTSIAVYGNLDGNVVINPRFFSPAIAGQYAHQFALTFQYRDGNIYFSLYDPHGVDQYYDIQNVIELVKHTLRNEVQKYYERLPVNEVVNFIQACPRFEGPQTSERISQNKGYCTLWSMMILHYMKYVEMTNIFPLDVLSVNNIINTEYLSSRKTPGEFMVGVLSPIIQYYLDNIKLLEDVLRGGWDTSGIETSQYVGTSKDSLIQKIYNYILRKYDEKSYTECFRFNTAEKFVNFINSNNDNSFDICLENGYVNSSNFPSMDEQRNLIVNTEITYDNIRTVEVHSLITIEPEMLNLIRSEYETTFPGASFDTGVLNYSGTSFVNYHITNIVKPERETEYEQSEDPSEDFFVKEFISMATLAQNDNKVGIWNVVTATKYRGSGLTASFMRTFLLPEAIRNSSNLRKNIFLVVLKDNVSAKTLYEQVGFVKLYETAGDFDIMYYDPSIPVKTELDKLYGPRPMDLSAPNSDVVHIHRRNKGFVVSFKKGNRKIVIEQLSKASAKGLYTKGLWNSLLRSPNRRQKAKRLERIYNIKIHFSLAKRIRGKRI